MHQLSVDDLIGSFGTTSFKIADCHEVGTAFEWMIKFMLDLYSWI